MNYIDSGLSKETIQTISKLESLLEFHPKDGQIAQLLSMLELLKRDIQRCQPKKR